MAGDSARDGFFLEGFEMSLKLERRDGVGGHSQIWEWGAQLF